MADISAKVGERSPNNFHDVALIQATLRLIRNPKGQSYLQAHYDGQCGTGTIAAIKAFQTDQGTAASPVPISVHSANLGIPSLQGPSILGIPPLRPPSLATMAPASSSQRPGLGLPALTLLDTAGEIKPGGPTLDKLNALLPGDFKGIRTAPRVHVVYWQGSAQAASASAKAISENTELHGTFRNNVADLVKKMFERYGIVLSLTPSGGRRTFQKQYDLKMDPNHDVTNAGPGESNHNFGQAVDIGFSEFKWMTPGGTPITDDWWLNKMNATYSHSVNELWTLRNAIAFGELGMLKSNKDGDDIHIQRYSDDDVSMTKSLAKLLDTAGAMSWRTHEGYECDLGFDGGAWHKVGKSTAIWDKSGPMEKAWIAAGKHVPVSAVTDADVRAMRQALRAEFEAAEAARDQWVAQPK